MVSEASQLDQWSKALLRNDEWDFAEPQMEKGCLIRRDKGTASRQEQAQAAPACEFTQPEPHGDLNHWDPSTSVPQGFLRWKG